MNKWKNCLYILLVVLMMNMCTIEVQAGTAQRDTRILFLSSYSYGWDTVQKQIEGIQAGISENTTLDYEFMDTKRVSDDEAMQLFYEGLKYRLEHVEPYDAVIVGDDAALIFAMTCRETLFDGIPIVFEGINDEEMALEAAKDPLVTGVLETLSVEKNIELGRKLNPDADKVIAILDDTVTGKAERKNFYSVAASYPELDFSEINSSQLTMAELQRALQEVDKNSILIYVVMTEDASGKRYSSLESVQMIAKYASVPALRMVEAGIGDGILGGNVVSMYQSGEIAAKIAMDIAEGIDSSEIDVVQESPNIYCVDEQMMKKFNLDASRLPEDTVIVNHQPTFIERNREVLIPSCILTIALLIIILWVCFDNFRRRKLLQELEEARAIMESASQHDFLTGLPNRSKFVEDLQKLVDDKIPCTIMMLDIDDFKKINDTFGHTAGDEALQQVAGRLKAMQSQILTSYRFAGDEFILILKSGQDMLIQKTAYQCRQVFSKEFALNGEKKKVCGSIGVASYPKDADNLEQLIVCADDAMYQVKKNGKNDFALYRKQS